MNKNTFRIIKNMIFFIVILVCCTISIHTIAASASKKYAFTLKPNLRGEWNITISGGSNVSKPTLYKKNIFGKEKKVKNAKITKTANGYVIKCSLEKKEIMSYISQLMKHQNVVMEGIMISTVVKRRSNPTEYNGYLTKIVTNHMS